MPRKKKEEFDELYPEEENEAVSTSKAFHAPPPPKTIDEQVIDKLNNAVSILGRNPRNRRECVKLINEAIKLIKDK